jgi:hypothetical protein
MAKPDSKPAMPSVTTSRVELGSAVFRVSNCLNAMD